MNEKIALGFHTCVDYELMWDVKVVEEQIKKFDIRAEDLKMDIAVDSERAVWIMSLAHLQAGVGCEMVPDRSDICESFAEHFQYRVTLGGTPTRAAIILDRLGYPSLLQTSCYNKYVKQLMPQSVRVLPGTSEEHKIYPHVVLQCSRGVRICANNIDFVTPKENRILISRDEDSLNMPVLDAEFGNMIKECEVFLLGSFTEILDLNILKDRMDKTRNMLSYLPEDAFVVMEDGCYIKEDLRNYVHERLADRVNLLSMNEDELQQYVGKKIDIMNTEEVMDAVKYVYDNVGIKNILVHSASWALIYGEESEKLSGSLESGVVMAATRFRIGDNFTKKDYEQTRCLKDKEESIVFCRQLKEKYDSMIYGIPCKDLSYVKEPTVVGLGDSFAGGLLPGLLKINRK